MPRPTSRRTILPAAVWTQENGSKFTAANETTQSKGFPKPDGGGSHYFYAGPGDNPSLRQDIDLPANQAAKIDAGLAKVRVNWSQNSAEGKDKGYVSVQFLNASGATMGNQQNSKRTAPTSWTKREGTATIPAGARKVRLRLKAERVSGTNANTYFDHVSMTLLLEAEPAPPPTTGGTTETYTYDANGSMTSGGGRKITYTSFNKPTKIEKGSDNASFT